MRLKFAFALVISLMLLAASKVHAGTERIDLQPRTKVIVFSTTKDGKWHSRLAITHEFTDAIIVACFEWPTTDAPVQCLVVVKADGETLMIPMRLLEIKT